LSVAGAAAVLGGCGGGDDGDSKAGTSENPRAQVDIHVGGFPDTVIGRRVRLEGQSSSTALGRVELDSDPAPFDGRFKRVATGHVGHLGALRFVVKPDRNTRYRVEAPGAASSKPVSVYVNPAGKVVPTLIGPTRVRVVNTLKLHSGATVNPTRVYFYFSRRGAPRYRLLGTSRAAKAGPAGARAVFEFTLAHPHRGDRYVACTRRNYTPDMGRAKAKVRDCGKRTIAARELKF
jgi:hypothetical protein